MTSTETDSQLPIGDEIFLDHLAHFVTDQKAAAQALRRAGFAPTPISIQVNPDPSGNPRPTGTGNVTAMFRRGYIEILFKTSATPLSGELDAAIARYPGVHLAAFAVSDAAGAHRRLGAAGFRTRPLVEMQRPAETETGPGTAAFTIARVESGEMAEGRIQILTHRTEQTVWQPRWLDHPNGATGLLDIVIAVADAAEAAARFSRFTARPATPTKFGQEIVLDRGRVQIVTSDAFTALLPGIAIPGLPFMGAYALSVTSLQAAATLLEKAAIPTVWIGQAVMAAFPPELGMGTWVLVEQASALPWRR